MLFSPKALANGTSETTNIDTAVNGTQGPNSPPLNGGDTLNISPSGSITTTLGFSSAIVGEGNSNKVNNQGKLETSGDFSYAIWTSGGTGTLVNNLGTISTAGFFSRGVDISGGFSSVVNQGVIIVSGTQAQPVITRDGNNSIINYGSISSAGYDSSGLVGFGGNTTIQNYGSIRTIGEISDGIYLDNNDGNTATNSGTISTQGDNAMGINVAGSNSVISNNGTISTTGSSTIPYPRGAEGIHLLGSNSIIINSGTITTTGGGSDGVYAVGNTNSISNRGKIVTSGDGADGIQILGSNNNSLNNTGSILTSGEYSNGIYAQGDGNSINNSGSISSSGDYGTGMAIHGNSNVITNSGTVEASGNEQALVGSPYGIYISGDSNTLLNTGVISTQKGYAVYVSGNGNAVSNSGSIISAEGYALYFDGTGNTFNSINNFLAGKINMGANGVVNIKTGANYSKLFTFEGSNLAINGTGPVPLFVNEGTKQAATYDPTIFAASSDALADMTSAISSLTPGRFNGRDKEHPIWARGFGTTSSYSGEYSGSNTTLNRNYVFSGVALGYDVIRSKDLVFGLLGGYGQTSLTADAEEHQSFNNTSDGAILGLYGQKLWKECAFDFALYGGIQSFQQQRYVNDNLAYLGNSSAQASYQGWWIAPEIAATVKVAEVNGWSLMPTARLRYAQQWMGGYTETGGGAANASVSGRNVTIGQSFVGVGTRKTIKTILGKNTKMVLDGQVGYMYRGAVGDDSVDVTMIGQSLALPTEISSRNAVAASAGVALDLSSSITFKIRGDAAAGGGMNYVAGGWAGLSFKF